MLIDLKCNSCLSTILLIIRFAEEKKKQVQKHSLLQLQKNMIEISHSVSAWK